MTLTHDPAKNLMQSSKNLNKIGDTPVAACYDSEAVGSSPDLRVCKLGLRNVRRGGGFRNKDS